MPRAWHGGCLVLLGSWQLELLIAAWHPQARYLLLQPHRMPFGSLSFFVAVAFIIVMIQLVEFRRKEYAILVWYPNIKKIVTDVVPVSDLLFLCFCATKH